MDQVEGDYRFKPGRGLAKFCRDHMCTRDLLYCLLQGRPLVVIGEPSQEKWAEFLSCVCATFTLSKIGIETLIKMKNNFFSFLSSMIRRLVRVLWMFVPGHSRFTLVYLFVYMFVYFLVCLFLCQLPPGDSVERQTPHF